MNKAPEPFTAAPDQKFKRGAMLIQASDQPDDAWLITDGYVRQFDFLPNGSEFSLNIYRPGALLALTWLYGGVPNHHCYEALTGVTVKRIKKEEYRAYIQLHPNEAITILERLSRGLDGMFSRITANSQNDAVARILNEIRIDSNRFPGDDDRALTSTMLAKRTGLARETVSRNISRLISDGTIKRVGHGLQLTK